MISTGCHLKSCRVSPLSDSGPSLSCLVMSRALPVLACCLLLASCRVPDQESGVGTLPEETPSESGGISSIRDSRESGPEERQRQQIADWLYEGLRALREDHLMVPPDDSAHAWFSRVLALEPGNRLALEGLQDITSRYVELAELSARQGQFDNSEQFLRRAALVNPGDPRIESGRERVEMERSRTHSVHSLDNSAVARRDATAILSSLSEPAQLLSANPDSLYVVITAPDDEQGRWIYELMREQLDVQRLPGDIEIGGKASVRLVNRG